MKSWMSVSLGVALYCFQHNVACSQSAAETAGVNRALSGVTGTWGQADRCSPQHWSAR